MVLICDAAFAGPLYWGLKKCIFQTSESARKRNSERYFHKFSLEKFWTYVRPCQGNPKREQRTVSGCGFREFGNRCQKTDFQRDTGRQGASVGGGNFWVRPEKLLCVILWRNILSNDTTFIVVRYILVVKNGYWQQKLYIWSPLESIR